jgi:hypothetical protein
MSATKLSYALQEEIIYGILTHVPDPDLLPASFFEAMFKEMYGLTMTRSCYMRAKERASQVPHAAKTEREKYYEALFLVYPDLSPGQVQTKIRLCSGETPRLDVIGSWKRRIRARPILTPEQLVGKLEDARLVIERVEAQWREPGSEAGR